MQIYFFLRTFNRTYFANKTERMEFISQIFYLPINLFDISFHFVIFIRKRIKTVDKSARRTRLVDRNEGTGGGGRVRNLSRLVSCRLLL